MKGIDKIIKHYSSLDLPAYTRVDGFLSGSTKSRSGQYLIRYSTFLNHLSRISVQCGLQLTAGTFSQTGPAVGQIIWRLTSECFAIIVTANNVVQTDGEFQYRTHKLDDLVSITAVYFEFNHDKAVPCPELAMDLNMGKYSSLLQHIDNLLTIYAVPGDKIDRARAYLCLQALEQDFSMLTQAMRSDLVSNSKLLNACKRGSNQKHDALSMRELVNRSLVGHFVGRTGGRLARLTYLVTSAQALIYKAMGHRKNDIFQHNSKLLQNINIGFGSQNGLTGGFLARIGLCPRLSCIENTTMSHQIVQRLPFIPLVTLQKDSFGISVPHFAQPDEIKCISIEAEFVLHLDPPIPITTDAIKKLERITGLTNSEMFDQIDEDIVLLILRQHGQEHLYGINTHLQIPNLTQHSYQIQSDVKAYLVKCIPFTCSNQIGEIISILREQSSALAFYETFIIHPNKPVEKDPNLTFNFNLKLMKNHLISLEFDHPLKLSKHVSFLVKIESFGVKCIQYNQNANYAPILDGITVDGDLDECNFPDSDCDYIDYCQQQHFQTCSDPVSPKLIKHWNRMLSQTHTLPIGLVWLLQQFKCPIHEELKRTNWKMFGLEKKENKLTEEYASRKQNEPKDFDNKDDRGDDYDDGGGGGSDHGKVFLKHEIKIDKGLIEHLHSMLDRVQSNIFIHSDSHGTGGILSGGSHTNLMDFESTTIPMMMGSSSTMLKTSMVTTNPTMNNGGNNSTGTGNSSSLFVLLNENFTNQTLPFSSSSSSSSCITKLGGKSNPMCSNDGSMPMKMSPLPPGVMMITPPPNFLNTEDYSVDPTLTPIFASNSMISNIRDFNPNSNYPIPTNTNISFGSSRGLRLDDLLAEPTIYQSQRITTNSGLINVQSDCNFDNINTINSCSSSSSSSNNNNNMMMMDNSYSKIQQSLSNCGGMSHSVVMPTCTKSPGALTTSISYQNINLNPNNSRTPPTNSSMLVTLLNEESLALSSSSSSLSPSISSLMSNSSDRHSLGHTQTISSPPSCSNILLNQGPASNSTIGNRHSNLLLPPPLPPSTSLSLGAFQSGIDPSTHYAKICGSNLARGSLTNPIHHSISPSSSSTTPSFSVGQRSKYGHLKSSDPGGNLVKKPRKRRRGNATPVADLQTGISMSLPLSVTSSSSSSSVIGFHPNLKQSKHDTNQLCSTLARTNVNNATLTQSIYGPNSMPATYSNINSTNLSSALIGSNPNIVNPFGTTYATSCTPNISSTSLSASMTNLTSFTNPSTTNIPMNKSVYDFDDAASSSFVMPTMISMSSSSNNSLSFSSGSSMTSPKSIGTPSSSSSSLSSSYTSAAINTSNSTTISTFQTISDPIFFMVSAAATTTPMISSTCTSTLATTLGGSTVSCASGPERTIERKTSLKLTIKTVPTNNSTNQQVTSTPKQPQLVSDLDKSKKSQSFKSNTASIKTNLSSTLSSTLSSSVALANTGSVNSKIRFTQPVTSSSLAPQMGGSLATVQQGSRKHKRRSVEGKPSAYMLQMLQHANSTINSTSDTMTSDVNSITMTSSSSSGSLVSSTNFKHAKSSLATNIITSVAVNNSYNKNNNNLLSHSNALVKKERKRRLNHNVPGTSSGVIHHHHPGFIEKTQFSSLNHLNLVTPLVSNELADLGDESPSKMMKLNRLPKPVNVLDNSTTMNSAMTTCSTVVGTAAGGSVNSGTTTVGYYTTYTSVSPNSLTMSKKKKLTTYQHRNVTVANPVNMINTPVNTMTTPVTINTSNTNVNSILQTLSNTTISFPPSTQLNPIAASSTIATTVTTATLTVTTPTSNSNSITVATTTGVFQHNSNLTTTSSCSTNLEMKRMKKNHGVFTSNTDVGLVPTQNPNVVGRKLGRPSSMSNMINPMRSNISKGLPLTTPNANVVSSSSTTSGLIKGYKIPKKKNISNPIGMGGTNPNSPAGLSSVANTNATTADKTIGASVVATSLMSYGNPIPCVSSSTNNIPNTTASLEQIQTNFDLLASSSSSLSSSSSSLLSTGTNAKPASDLITFHDSPNVSTDHRSNMYENALYTNLQQQQQIVTNTSSLASSLSTYSIGQQLSQQPRKSSAKSISDIVDKLRAKSTNSTTNSLSFTSPMVTTVITSTTFGPTTIGTTSVSSTAMDEFGSDRNKESMDQWRDNIFDKFCQNGTPTPNLSESVLMSQCPSSTNIPNLIGNTSIVIANSDTNTTTINNRSKSSIIAPNNNSSSTNRDLNSEISKSNDLESSSNRNKAPDSDSKANTFEVIKASTDTPASPTECTFLSTSSANSSSNLPSKIIPISPTSNKSTASSSSSSVSSLHGETSPNKKLSKHHTMGTMLPPYDRKSNSTRFQRGGGGSGSNSSMGNGLTMMMMMKSRMMMMGPRANNSDTYMHLNSGSSNTGGVHPHLGRLNRGAMNNLHHNKAQNFKSSSAWCSANMDYASGTTLDPAIGMSTNPNPISPPGNTNANLLGSWMMSNSSGSGSTCNPNAASYSNPHHNYHGGSGSVRQMRPNYGSGSGSIGKSGSSGGGNSGTGSTGPNGVNCNGMYARRHDAR